MRRERRAEDFDWLEAEGLDAVEHPLARSEQDGNDVERELVDHARRERLADRRCATRDVDAGLAGRCARLSVGSVEALRTKWKLVPPSIPIGSWGWWVSTNTGAW